MYKILRIFFILSCGVYCLLLTGCLTPKYVEKKSYLLNVISCETPKKISKNYLLVNHTIATAPFDQVNFIYRTGANKYVVDYYNGFMTPPTTQLDTILANYFRVHSNFYPLTKDNLLAKYQLDVELTECYADYRNPNSPSAVMALHLVMTDIKRHDKVILDKTICATTPLQTKTGASLVKAYDENLQIMLPMATRMINKKEHCCINSNA
jgi:ABC-type uncharacterized transport system auxiliary subunit